MSESILQPKSQWVPDTSMIFTIGLERFEIHKDNGPFPTQVARLKQQLESGSTLITFTDRDGSVVNCGLAGKTQYFPKEFAQIASVMLDMEGKLQAQPVRIGEDMHREQATQKGTVIAPDSKADGRFTPIVNVALDRTSLAAQLKANFQQSIADVQKYTAEQKAKGNHQEMTGPSADALAGSKLFTQDPAQLAEAITDDIFGKA